jgi:membrane protease YdiL (CAAX protease family)
MRRQIPDVWRNKHFWTAAFLVLLINSVDQSYVLLSVVKSLDYSNDALRSAVVSLATYLVSFFTVVLPSWLLYRLYDRQQSSFYGLTFDANAKVRPYLSLLCIALVLVSVSVLFSGMSNYYPVYRRMGIYNNADELGIPRALAVTAFETVYASNFIAVELFFRGVFVFMFARFLGPKAILPMAACYMVFHFGKPLPETLSSFFGGYLLGVLALYSRNIWGGIVLHIGIALFMELVAGLI